MMDLSNRVADAVVAARAIRREIQSARRRGRYRWSDKHLDGACGLASAFLAIEMMDTSVLRLGKFIRNRHREFDIKFSDHAWCEIDGYVVDITATQFHHHLPAVYVVRRLNTDRYLVDHNGLDAAHRITAWAYPNWATILRKLRALA